MIKNSMTGNNASNPKKRKKTEHYLQISRLMDGVTDLQKELDKHGDGRHTDKHTDLHGISMVAGGESKLLKIPRQRGSEGRLLARIVGNEKSFKVLLWKTAYLCILLFG